MFLNWHARVVFTATSLSHVFTAKSLSHLLFLFWPASVWQFCPCFSWHYHVGFRAIWGLHHTIMSPSSFLFCFHFFFFFCDLFSCCFAYLGKYMPKDKNAWNLALDHKFVCIFPWFFALLAFGATRNLRYLFMYMYK